MKAFISLLLVVSSVSAFGDRIRLDVAQQQMANADAAKPKTQKTQYDVIPGETDGTTPTAPQEVDVDFDYNTLQNPAHPEIDYTQFYDAIVVINKNQRAETLDMYFHGNLIKHTRVSTGRERAEIHIDGNDQTPTHSYWSNTPTGYYNVEYLDIDHQSKTWKDGYMPWAVFFTSGIATHRSPHEPDAAHPDKNIGTRASGACVRMHENDARDVFWVVRSTGGPIESSEQDQMFTGDMSQWLRSNQVDGFTNRFDLPTYDGDPKVPLLRKDGTFKLNDKGQILAKYGFKTLYVVINREPAPTPAPRPKFLNQRSGDATYSDDQGGPQIDLMNDESSDRVLGINDDIDYSVGNDTAIGTTQIDVSGNHPTPPADLGFNKVVSDAVKFKVLQFNENINNAQTEMSGLGCNMDLGMLAGFGDAFNSNRDRCKVLRTYINGQIQKRDAIQN